MLKKRTQTDLPATIRTRWWIWLLLAFFFFEGGAADCTAEENESRQWEITADRITYDQITNTYTATGDVRIMREGRVLTADKVLVDQGTEQALAEGDVRLRSGQDVLSGSRLQLDLADETGALSDGRLFFSENHLYVTGELILKTGPQTYMVQNASATTCDGPDPDWRITGKELNVTIEGYGTIKHAALWAKRIPLLYTPYFLFPVKLERQTGLLTPEIGMSDRKGTEYLQPFFWAISDSTDASIFGHYMTERGLRAGAEFRYAAGDLSWGTIMAEGLDDRRIDDGLLDNSEDWGYIEPGQDFLRTNDQRYWLRGKLNQDLPLGMTAKVDLDVVSDQDYLHEFRDGFLGYEETADYFLQTFGRDIDDFTDPLRQNQLNVSRLWSKYAFNADVRWYHDAIDDRPAGSFTPLQDLPEISLDGIKQRIATSPFYYDLSSTYNHFYRETGDRGHRADLYPRLYLPTRLFDAVSVEPSAGIRQTYWYMDRFDTDPLQDENDFYRAIYDFKLDASTDVYRIYDIDTAGSDRIKHNIRPQLIYQYIPDEDQSEYPDFDVMDRIESRNRVTFALTQTLVARQPAPADGRTSRAVYNPFLRFRLEESFDIDRHRDGDSRPFSDLSAELDLRPGRYIALNADALWSPYDGEFNGYNAALRLWDMRGDQLSVDYRFTRETAAFEQIKSVTAGAVWQVTPHWQLRGAYERDLAREQFLESGFGVSYLAQCWAVDVDYREDEQNNSSIAVMVHLAGLGGLGL